MPVVILIYFDLVRAVCCFASHTGNEPESAALFSCCQPDHPAPAAAINGPGWFGSPRVFHLSAIWVIVCQACLGAGSRLQPGSLAFWQAPVCRDKTSGLQFQGCPRTGIDYHPVCHSQTDPGCIKTSPACSRVRIIQPEQLQPLSYF